MHSWVTAALDAVLFVGRREVLLFLVSFPRRETIFLVSRNIVGYSSMCRRLTRALLTSILNCVFS